MMSCPRFADGREPSLRFRKGGISVLLPPMEADIDAPLSVTVDCVRGERAAGSLPRNEDGTTSAAYIVLSGTFPLNGFRIMIDGATVYEHPEAVAGTVISRSEWEGLEVIQFDMNTRGFEISRPSLRFRDGHSYLYVARYVGKKNDAFETSISGDFGTIVLGRMLHKTVGGTYISNGTEFRLSDYGITVLDEFDLFIDGRKVFSNPSHNFLVFTHRGTVTKYPRGDVNAVFMEDVYIDCEGELESETELSCGLIWRRYYSEDHMTFTSRVIEEDGAPVSHRDEVPSEMPPSFEEPEEVIDYDGPTDPPG